MGKYEYLNGGFTESISMTFSGGIHNLFTTKLILNATNGAPISDQFSAHLARTLQEQFGNAQIANPNMEEMFQIFIFALKAKHLIGIHSNSVNRINFSFQIKFIIFYQGYSNSIWYNQNSSICSDSCFCHQ